MSYNIYGDPVVSMSDLKPKEGILKRAKNSLTRAYRRATGKETGIERAERLSRTQSRKSRKANANMKPFGGGKRKRRKTQRKPKRTRRTKRRTRKSRR